VTPRRNIVPPAPPPCPATATLPPIRCGLPPPSPTAIDIVAPCRLPPRRAALPSTALHYCHAPLHHDLPPPTTVTSSHSLPLCHALPPPRHAGSVKNGGQNTPFQCSAQDNQTGYMIIIGPCCTYNTMQPPRAHAATPAGSHALVRALHTPFAQATYSARYTRTRACHT
jgi:hypothetical protein